VALRSLGVRFSFYSPRESSFDAFRAWIQKALEAGDPVLAGVKVLPTKHPEWGLDHFVLIVGHGVQGLLVNTTWGHRAWVSDTTTTGLSLKNVAYGIRLHGLVLPPNSIPARVALLDERTDAVRLRVTCEGLTTGDPYRIEQRRSASDPQPLWSNTAIAEDGRVVVERTVEANAAAQFRCVR
jgi:hypothetical protein